MPLNELEYTWVDAAFTKSSEATVPILTHALHYGTGVFEGIRAYPGEGNQLYVFRLHDHMKRLMNSARLIYLNLPYTGAELAEATVTLLRKCDVHDTVYIRPIAFVAYGRIDLDYRQSPVKTAICAFYFKRYFEKPGLRVCISSWRRFSETSTPPQAKACGNYLNSTMAKVEAGNRGYDEAILLDQDGHVSEASGENIFLVKNGSMYTPPLSCSILDGITRNSVVHLARDHGIAVEERVITRSELLTCDEVFLTGTAAEISPVFEIDGTPVGNGQIGPLTKRIQEWFDSVVAGRDSRYSNWLTPVY